MPSEDDLLLSTDFPISNPELIGLALRQLRQSRQMTVAELAEKVDLSKGYISLLESGKRTPHWSTLMRIVHALGETLCRFLDRNPTGQSEEEFSSPCLHAGLDELILVSGSIPDEWGHVPGADQEGYTWIITPERGRINSEIVRICFPPHTPWTPTRISFGASATLFGLQGKLLLEIGGTDRDEYILQKDQTLQFNARLPHRLRNFTDEVVEALMYVTPAAF